MTARNVYCCNSRSMKWLLILYKGTHGLRSNCMSVRLCEHRRGRTLSAHNGKNPARAVAWECPAIYIGLLTLNAERWALNADERRSPTRRRRDCLPSRQRSRRRLAVFRRQETTAVNWTTFEILTRNSL